MQYGGTHSNQTQVKPGYEISLFYSPLFGILSDSNVKSPVIFQFRVSASKISH